MKASDMMPIDHDQARMRQLSDDRRTWAMELPGMPVEGRGRAIAGEDRFRRRRRSTR
jgi:hypothetical protein